MQGIDWEALKAVAVAARGRAYAPYSAFQVGAAILADDGRVYSGCNVENATYGLTVCAERNAIGAMVGAGSARPVAVAVVVDAGEVASPCGACRQVLLEFGAPEVPVRSYTLGGLEARWTLGELLPAAFTGRSLSRRGARGPGA